MTSIPLLNVYDGAATAALLLTTFSRRISNLLPVVVDTTKQENSVVQKKTIVSQPVKMQLSKQVRPTKNQ